MNQVRFLARSNVKSWMRQSPLARRNLAKQNVALHSRWYHSSRIQPRDSVDLNKSKSLHKEMQQKLGQTSTAGTNNNTASLSEAEKGRKARNRQALLNVWFGFMTMLLAVQSLKSERAKRKKEAELLQVSETLDQKHAIIRDLLSDDTVRRLAQKCSRELTVSKPEPVKRNGGWLGWWWGTSLNQSFDEVVDDDEDSFPKDVSLEDRVFQVLRKELYQHIGTAGLSDEDRDKVLLDEMKLSDKQLLQELEAELLVDEENGTTTIKKRVVTL